MQVPGTHYLTALGIGLLIGLERERAKSGGPAGIRTFALASVLGALAMSLGGAVMTAAAVVGVAVLLGVSNYRAKPADPGLTTEVALLLMPLLGALSLSEPLLSASVAVVVAVLLAAKPGLHRFVRGSLTEAEVNDGLLLAVAAVVIWPLLPDRGIGPFDALNLRTLWLVVILVLAIGTAGHVANRLVGARFGLPVSGLASGFVSSVATTAAMGGRAREHPAQLDAAVAGGTLSSVATFVQMALVLVAVSAATARAMAPMLAAGSVVLIVYGAVFTMRAARSPPAGPATDERAFGIGAALLMAAGMAAILVLTAAAQPYFGTAGVTVSAALGGIVDTHAAAVSVAALVAGGKLPAGAAAVPILCAMSVNAAMKVVMATVTGSAAYVVRVGPGVALAMVACWATGLLTGAI